jgi:hypothetical protein
MLMSLSGYRKTAEEPWWIVNVYRSNVGSYRRKDFLNHWGVSDDVGTLSFESCLTGWGGRLPQLLGFKPSPKQDASLKWIYDTTILSIKGKKINDGYIGSLLDSCKVHQSNFDTLNFHYTFKDDNKLIYIQHELNSICWTFYMHSRTSNFRHCLLILKWNSNY